MHRRFSYVSVLGRQLHTPGCGDRTRRARRRMGSLDLQELERNGQLCWHPAGWWGRGTCNHALRLWLPTQAKCKVGHQLARRPGLNPSFSGPQFTHLGKKGLASIPAPNLRSPRDRGSHTTRQVDVPFCLEFIGAALEMKPRSPSQVESWVGTLFRAAGCARPQVTTVFKRRFYCYSSMVGQQTRGQLPLEGL